MTKKADCQSCGKPEAVGVFPADGMMLALCADCLLIDPDAVPDINDPSWKGYIDHETDIDRFFDPPPRM